VHAATRRAWSIEEGSERGRSSIVASFFIELVGPCDSRGEREAE
jgi:hypothetical protein